MNELFEDDLTVKRTVKSTGTQRIQVIDDLDVVVIDVVQENPDISISDVHRFVDRRIKRAVSLSTVRYRLYTLEREGILSSQKRRSGVHFRVAADDLGRW
ncbi:MAG: hypothetical protein ACXV2E_04260 [Halobacteriota archaeon]